MKKCFVFCHGFCFDKHFWIHLAPYFAHEKCLFLDLGYFGGENEGVLSDVLRDHPVHLIGVGHSLGLIKLLDLQWPFKYLVGLNGFVNFLGHDPVLRITRARELDALKRHLQVSPQTTLENFYRRCGVSLPHDHKRLKEHKALDDLHLLSQSFCIAERTQTLMIGSRDDVIVPPTLMHDNFKNCSNVRIQMLNKGGHGLGFQEHYAVYQSMINFINDAL